MIMVLRKKTKMQDNNRVKEKVVIQTGKRIKQKVPVLLLKMGRIRIMEKKEAKVNMQEGKKMRMG